MKMTLEEAKYCLSNKPNGCFECKYEKQGEFDCRGSALEIGEAAINYLMVGLHLAKEVEEKDR